MENFPSSSIGLPNSVKYDLPPSLSDSARSYSVAVSPNGISQVTGSALPTTVFTANSGSNLSSFAQNLISFDIPCGQGLGIFLDPKETILNFRLTHVVTTGSSTTAGKLNLIGSASSFIDSLTLYHNNTPLEIVQNYGLLFNQFLNTNVNYSERWGGMSICMGCDTNTNAGIDLPHVSANTYYFNFAIPLISIIGLNTENKLIPVGSIQNLQLQIMTSQVLPYASHCTAVVTQPVISAPVLDQFSLNMRYIDIGAESAAMLSQTLQDGKWFIKSKTYTNSNVTIPSGTSGFSSLLLQIRNSSVNSLFLQYGIGTASLAVAPSYSFDSFNPACVSLQCSIAGMKFPNKALNPSQRPAECYTSLIQAWGSSSFKSFGGVMYRGAYGSTIPSRPTQSDNLTVVPSAGTRAVSSSDSTTENLVDFPSMHYQGFDLQRVNGSLFSGVNTRSSPPYIDLNLGVASTSTITCYAWGMSDLVLVIDVPRKQVQAFI